MHIFFIKRQFNTVKLSGMSLFKAGSSVASAHDVLHSPPVCSWAMFALDYRFSAILYWQIAATAPQTDIA